MAGKIKSTPQEALIAELLGDVGKLNDAIKKLPDGLKKSVEPTVLVINKLNDQANNMAAKRLSYAKLEIDNYTKQQKALIVHEVTDAIRIAHENEIKKIKSINPTYNVNKDGSNIKLFITTFMGATVGTLFAAFILYLLKQAL